jgi:DNA-binding NtrC family response regulator
LDFFVPFIFYFGAGGAAAGRRQPPALSPDVASALRDHAWPGNVRELKHVIERAYEAAAGEPLALTHLPNELLERPALTPQDVSGRRPTLEEVERRYIAATLQHVRGNQTEAARMLGISRKALWEKRKRYGLE